MAHGGASLTVLTIGKTGSGKSALCNVVTNSKDFPTGRGGKSKTQRCQAKTVVTSRGKLTVVDTPGTRDVMDMNAAAEELRRALQDCPDGIDAFLVVMRCDVRMTDEELKAIEEAVDAFGPECCKRAIVVFTNGDEYNNEESEFGNDLAGLRKSNPRFDQLMSKFGNRWLLMDNGKDSGTGVRERQVGKLLAMVAEVAKLNPQRFRKEDQEAAANKSKEKIKALKEHQRHLEEMIHTMQLQRLEDKIDSMKGEQAMQEELWELKMLIQREQMKLVMVYQAAAFVERNLHMRIDFMQQIAQSELRAIEDNRERNNGGCNVM